MPISEDEYEYGSHQSQMHPGMSKAEQRRSNKPIMEKRRRARINHCLDELKNIILDAMNKDPARHSKLEKADILEMTVKHLQTIQRQQMTAAVHADPGVVLKFHSGFSECAAEVRRYISRLDGVEPQVKQRLVTHLASCVNGLQQISPFANSGTTTLPPPQNPSPEDVNNNSASARLQMMTGLQLIPSRLPSGELALLLPNSQHLPFFPTPLENQVSTTSESPKAPAPIQDRSHNSAFKAVCKDKFYSRSPLPSPTSTTSSFGEDSCDRPYPSPNHPPEVSSTSENMKELDSTKSADSQHLLQIAPPNISEQLRFQNSKIQTPLTVITSNEMLREIPQKFERPHSSGFKDALDFSIKKDAFPLPLSQPVKRPLDDISDKLVIKSTDFQPPLKIAKLYTENNTQDYSDRRSLYEIQNHTPKINHNQFEIIQVQNERKSLISNENQPSTSSEVSRDMWRPW